MKNLNSFSCTSSYHYGVLFCFELYLFELTVVDSQHFSLPFLPSKSSYLPLLPTFISRAFFFTN